MLRTVLFDLDGVLIDSFEAWLAVMRDAARKWGRPPVEREEFRSVFGQDTRADIEAFLPDCTVEELDAFFAERFPKHVHLVTRSVHALPVLHTVRARGLSRWIVTNTNPPLATDLLRRLDLLDHVEGFVGSGEAARNKPHPEPVLLALDRAGARADEALLVGDSAFDRDAAVAAGVRFVGLGIDGDSRIESLLDLLPLLPAGPTET